MARQKTQTIKTEGGPATIVAPAWRVAGMRMLNGPARYTVGQDAPTEFPQCRGQMVCAIVPGGTAVKVEYANGWYEEFAAAAVSVLYEPEKK